MIHWLRTSRHASPAVTKRVPGYCTGAWIRMPASGASDFGRLLVPSMPPCTPRHIGALFPGCTRLRCPLFCSMYPGSLEASRFTSGFTSKMFWPWMPPGGATCPGGRSSGATLAAGAVVVDPPPAGAAVVDCANAPLAKAAVRTAAAAISRNFRILVLPLHGADLQFLLPAVAVARLPALGHELPVGALEGRGVALDAAGGLFALGARRQHE